MKSYSVTLHGHRTSVSLEQEFWVVLKQAARNRRVYLWLPLFSTSMMNG